MIEYDKVKNLIGLIQENPELDVILLVDNEIVVDDSYHWWAGSFGKSEIAYYICSDEEIYFRDISDIEDVVIDIKGYEWYEQATEEEMKKEFLNLPWKEIIRVYVELPNIY